MSYLRDQVPGTTTPLQDLVRHAHAHSPFYRRRFEQLGINPLTIFTAEDLKSLPTTSRSELQSEPWGLLAVPKEDIVQTSISTGTTGADDVLIHFDWDDLFVRGLRGMLGARSAHRLLSIEPGEMVFIALPYEVSVTGLAIHRALQDGLGACVVPLGEGGFYSDPRKAVRMMAQLQGEHLFTTPFYAVHLSEVAAELQIDPKRDLGLRKLWLVGESCSDALRQRIEALWGCPAYLYYGSLECGVIGVECSQQDGYHVATGLAEVELEASPQTPTTLRGEATGEVIATCLWRYASPLIRYKSGDIGHLIHTPCPCGLPGPRLRVLGRESDVLSVGGRELFAHEIEQVLLEEIPNLPPWFRLRPSRGQLCVEVPGHWPGAVRDIERAERRLGVRVFVESVAPEPYLGGKFRRLSTGSPE